MGIFLTIVLVLYLMGAYYMAPMIFEAMRRTKIDYARKMGRPAPYWTCFWVAVALVLIWPLTLTVVWLYKDKPSELQDLLDDIDKDQDYET